jgi:hypothetical protein
MAWVPSLVPAVVAGQGKIEVDALEDSWQILTASATAI